MLHPTGGDENLRPGFDNGQLPVGQLTSLRGSCPKGERSESIPPDGEPRSAPDPPVALRLPGLH